MNINSINEMVTKVLTSEELKKAPKYVTESHKLAEKANVEKLFSEVEKAKGVIIIDDTKDSFSKMNPLPLMSELDDRNMSLQRNLDIMDAIANTKLGKNFERIITQVKNHVPVILVKSKDSSPSSQINMLTRPGRIDKVLDIEV